MGFDYSHLVGKIITKCKSRKNFAALMGMSELALFNKLSGRTGFTQKEMAKAAEVLEFSMEEIPFYFFYIS